MISSRSNTFFALIIALVLINIEAFATHLRSADLIIEQPDCNNPLRFKITIIAYINTNTTSNFGGGSSFIYFGDGSFVDIDEVIETPRPDLGTNVGIATFVTFHTYQVYGTYTISYIEKDRSSGILNIEDSEDVPYVSKATISISSKYKCNNFPILSVPPLDRACSKVAFYHAPGAYDIDGDSLSYELTIPSSDQNTFAPYTSPVNSKYYTSFNTGNETGTGPPTFSIDPISGLLTWNAPGMLGEYNVAFKVIEWRKDSVTNTYTQLSSFVRDIQIIVEECTNIRPQLIIPRDLCVTAGASIHEIIKGTDTEKSPVKIEVFSEILNLDADENPATYSPKPAVFTSSDPFATVDFQWTTQCLHVRQQPYQVVFKITDSPPQGPKLVTFAIWNIRVLASPPVFQSATPDLVTRVANLEWESYACSNASAIQVWRKVGSAPFTPSACQNGIPKNLGYYLIATLPPTQTQYTDTNYGRGLAVGAQYCYRIIPYFNSPASTYGFASQELCAGPIQADAPVITHVSVEKTDKISGEIRVSWHKPFDINTEQFPEPYEYEIYRATGFYGEETISKVGRVTGTTFLDSNLNTDQTIYNYRIVLYGQPQNANVIVPIDTSSVASSEWLSMTPGVNSMVLTWQDSVPWSNVAFTKPYHLIYRGEDSKELVNMILHDSVKVSVDGFTYTDTNLSDDIEYSYRILTRGTYGNPAIPIQENYSQVVTSYPVNTLPPCSPIATVDMITCEQYLKINNCGEEEFTNKLHWNVKSLRQCRKNIKFYTVYAANTSDQEFVPIATVQDTSYADTGLLSFARCYRITATDEFGIEGAPGETKCNDNCPYYILPNVITPNNDSYNDALSPHFENIGDAEPGEGDVFRCPRFVQHVSLSVFNRWGQSVYDFESKDESEVSIEWKGLDKNGNKLPTGVYFYTADITFNTLNPELRKKSIRGWIHVLAE